MKRTEHDEHDEFKTRLKQTLAAKPKLSLEAESALFAQAETLLAKRRERLSLREALAQQAKQSRAETWISIRQRTSKWIEFFAIHPDAPATATVFITLLLAFITFHHGPSTTALRMIRYSDLPALPKTNKGPALYDSLFFAERQAYEREVEDAHRKTSGGI